MNTVKITREVVIYIEEEVNTVDYLQQTENARLTDINTLDELGHFGFPIFSLNPKLNRETGYNSITFDGQEHTLNDDYERQAVEDKLRAWIATGNAIDNDELQRGIALDVARDTEYSKG